MKNLILSGANGHMGRVISAYTAERDDCRIVAGIDRVTTRYADFPIFETPQACDVPADCIIDFSHPSLLAPVLERAVHTSTPIVVATTGLSEEQIALLHRTSAVVPVFFSFNMSLGINLLAELAKRAAAVLGPGFDIEIVEKHHNRKLDAPSGTAILLADALNEVQDGRFDYVYDRHTQHKKRTRNEIGIHSVRGGTIVGEHDVIFAGKDEVVTLSHTAMSKDIFATGAVNAALFLCGRPAGMYSMSDMVSAG